mmetsp:Transcript_20778/g.28929  ORF Transcript_20778/g.28929 Transcript_20778/m.28929 type:complete len:433 (+) Transcript_20778:139-1437(+)
MTSSAESNGAMTLLQAARSLETWNRRRNDHVQQQPKRHHYNSTRLEIVGNEMKRGRWGYDHPLHEQQGRSRRPLSYPSVSQSQYPLDWEARKTRQNSGERRIRSGMKRARDVNMYTHNNNGVNGVTEVVSSSFDSSRRFPPKRIARPTSMSSQTRHLSGRPFPSSQTSSSSSSGAWESKKGYHHPSSSSLTAMQDRSLRARILKESDDENSWSSENGGGGPSSGDSGGGGTSGNSRGTRSSGQTVGKSTSKNRADDLLQIEMTDPSEMSRTSGSSASTWSTLSNESKLDFNFQTLASMGIKEVSSSCMKDNMINVCISDIPKRFTCHACTNQVALDMVLKHNNKYPCEGRLAVGQCDQVHSYSFCRGALHSQDVGPLRHCTSCKRCMPLHSKHCNKCNKCYVFGSSSLKKIPRCPCEGLEENLVIDEGCHVA